MPDSTVPPTAATPEKKKFKRAKNDQRIAAEITAASRLLQTAGTDPDIQPIALARGIDAAELADAKTKVATAAQKWGVRLDGMAAEDHLVEETDTELEDLRDDYLAYREIGRNNFPSVADRAALGLSGDIPDGFNTLMTHIKAAYTAAKGPAYTALMTKRGYSPAVLNGLIATIDNLIADETDQTEAEGSAETKTLERDEAYQAMKDALRPIKGTLKGALRKRPDMLAKLGM
jgi:hypothetical protein